VKLEDENLDTDKKQQAEIEHFFWMNQQHCDINEQLVIKYK